MPERRDSGLRKDIIGGASMIGGGMNIETIISATSLLIAIMVAIIGDAGLLSFLDRANVRYIRTHTLKKGNDFVQGIILINQGRKLAKKILLKINYKNVVISDIQMEDEMFIKKPSIDEGGSGNNFVVLGFEGLAPKSQGTVYITINGQGEGVMINGTFDDRMITEENYSYKRPVSDSIAIILGLFALFWMFLGLFV